MRDVQENLLAAEVDASEEVQVQGFPVDDVRKHEVDAAAHSTTHQPYCRPLSATKSRKLIDEMNKRLNNTVEDSLSACVLPVATSPTDRPVSSGQPLPWNSAGAPELIMPMEEWVVHEPDGQGRTAALKEAGEVELAAVRTAVIQALPELLDRVCALWADKGRPLLRRRRLSRPPLVREIVVLSVRGQDARLQLRLDSVDDEPCGGAAFVYEVNVQQLQQTAASGQALNTAAAGVLVATRRKQSQFAALASEDARLLRQLASRRRRLTPGDVLAFQSLRTAIKQIPLASRNACLARLVHVVREQEARVPQLPVDLNDTGCALAWRRQMEEVARLIGPLEWMESSAQAWEKVSSQFRPLLKHRYGFADFDVFSKPLHQTPVNVAFGKALPPAELGLVPRTILDPKFEECREMQQAVRNAATNQPLDATSVLDTPLFNDLQTFEVQVSPGTHSLDFGVHGLPAHALLRIRARPRSGEWGEPLHLRTGAPISEQADHHSESDSDVSLSSLDSHSAARGRYPRSTPSEGLRPGAQGLRAARRGRANARQLGVHPLMEGLVPQAALAQLRDGFAVVRAAYDAEGSQGSSDEEFASSRLLVQSHGRRVVPRPPLSPQSLQADSAFEDTRPPSAAGRGAPPVSGSRRPQSAPQGEKNPEERCIDEANGASLSPAANRMLFPKIYKPDVGATRRNAALRQSPDRLGDKARPASDGACSQRLSEGLRQLKELTDKALGVHPNESLEVARACRLSGAALREYLRPRPSFGAPESSFAEQMKRVKATIIAQELRAWHKWHQTPQIFGAQPPQLSEEAEEQLRENTNRWSANARDVEFVDLHKLPRDDEEWREHIQAREEESRRKAEEAKRSASQRVAEKIKLAAQQAPVPKPRGKLRRGSLASSASASFSATGSLELEGVGLL